MENENNPSEADTSAEGVTAEEANENVSSANILETINTATGRSYKNEEEAIKGIKETNSYVGKVGKYKDVINAIEESKGGEQGAIEALKGLTSSDSTETKEVDTNKVLIDKISALEETNFFNANADFAAQKELISELRKDGETLAETVERKKDLLAQLKTSTENQGSKSVIHSNDRTVVENSGYQADFKKAQETGNWAEFLMKHKGVK